MFLIGLNSTFFGKDYNEKLEEDIRKAGFGDNDKIQLNQFRKTSLWNIIKDKCSNEDALNKILNLDGDNKTISKNELKVLLRLLDKSSNEIYEDGYDNKYDTALQDVSDDELQRTYKLTQGTSARCSWGDITKNDQQRIIMPLKINGGKEITVIVESSEETEFFKNIFKNLDPETLLNISKEIDVIRFAPNGDKSVYKPDTNEILINISPPKGGWQPSNGLRPAESIARSLTHEVAHALDANKVGQFDSSNDAKFKELFGQLQDVLKEMGIEHTNSHDNYLLSNEMEYLAEYRASSGGQGKTDGSSSYDELLEQLRDMASRGQNTEKVQEAFKLIKNLDLLADNLITNAENADKNERVPANSQSYAELIKQYTPRDVAQSFRPFLEVSDEPSNMFRFSKNSDEFSNISYNISHKNWKFFKTDYFLGVMGKLDEVYHKKDLNTLQEITNSKSPVTDDSLKKMKEILNKNYFLSKSQLTEEQRQVIKENLDSNNATFFQSDDWKEMLTILNKSYKQDELNKLHNVVDLIS